MTNYKSEVEALDNLSSKYEELKKEIAKVIVGQEQIIHNVLVSIFGKGHCLLIGVPGLAKTLLVNTIAKALGLENNRIQFTPDLMPSDIVGVEILNENRQFNFNKGPVFTNFLLADEINRTPPKTQAALLEAMQEKSITIAGKSYSLDNPFFVLATQNPIEQEGTYPLPEAQLDRFMFNVILDYPTYQQEIDIVKNTTTDKEETVNIIMNKQEILYFQELLQKIPVPDNVYEYAVNLSAKTRPQGERKSPIAEKYLLWGAGPRASQYLIIGAKTNAVLKGKYSPDIEDVKAIAHNVLRHRIVKNYKAEADNYSIDRILNELIEN